MKRVGEWSKFLKKFQKRFSKELVRIANDPKIKLYTIPFKMRGMM